MIGIIGHKTTIAEAFMGIAGDSYRCGRLEDMAFDLPRYLIAMGYLCGERIADQAEAEQNRAWQVNFVQIVAFCDTVFDANPFARICIIGSASADRGSYDAAYMGAKAAIGAYIRTKRLDRARQQLVGIAPHIIADSGMTERRSDLAVTLQRGLKTRRGCWISAHEVAQLAHFLLYVDQGAICNHVVTMDGGNE